MALSQSKQFAFFTTIFGIVSFILGIVAELKKPPSGTPIRGKDVIICKFQDDPTVALGSLSTLAVLICAALGILSVFFPYKGRSVPKNILFKSNIFLGFFATATVLTLVGVGFTLWATITEAFHQIWNVHSDLENECATAMTGLFGGAAFLNLNACLFWLIALMLTHNVREDYFDEDGEEYHHNGDRDSLATTTYN